MIKLCQLAIYAICFIVVPCGLIAQGKSDSIEVYTSFSQYHKKFRKDLSFSHDPQGDFRIAPILTDSSFRFSAMDCRFKRMVELWGIRNIDFQLLNSKVNGPFNLVSVKGKSCVIDNSNITSNTLLTVSTISNLEFSNDTINNLHIGNCLLGRLQILFCKFSGSVSVSGTVKGGINLGFNQFSPNSVIDLHVLRSYLGENHRIPIRILKPEIAHIQLNYRNFWLNTRNMRSDLADSVYQALLAHFKDLKQEDNYNVLQWDYRHYKGDGTWIGRMKNKSIDQYENYGKNLGFMMEFTVIILFIFSFVNYFILDKLKKVYAIANLPKYLPSQNRQAARRFYSSLVFTSVVFFNPIIKIEKLKYDRPLLLLWFLFVDFSGLVLLYYILHYLIKLK